MRAAQAADLGLACIHPYPPRTLKEAFIRWVRPPALPTTVATVLAAGRTAAITSASRTMLKFLGWPIAATTVAWPALHAAGQQVLAILSCAVLLMLVSLVVHELGHVVVLRVIAPRAPALFTARAGRFRLIRGALPTHQDLAVTLAGPAAPFIVPAVLFAVASGTTVHVWTALAIAVAHASLLLRPDGDGAMLRAVLSRPRPHRPT
ncbi:hypothetical protein GMA12_16720 [Kocuria sediminis]|uniref:DUF3267 domain-containing protein n=1 Tax=Kocuria sediminis TaxID=1038857 RepID=A0A6N8GTX1_9MICC|nr:hypothetical protein [Kocuria sediminis]MUN64763.1 hypothetical protein [Kocuria sediminis]